jgi:hypothetical protein
LESGSSFLRNSEQDLRGPAEPHTSDPRGGEAFIGALDDEFADELGQRGEDVENEPAAGVVVSSASCSDLNPMTRRRSSPTIEIRSCRLRPRRHSSRTTIMSPRRR